MKKKFSLLAVICIVIAASSCQKDSLFENDSEGLVFTASIGNSLETKTTITSDRKVNWESGDKISINGVEYSATPKTDATKADFSKVSGDDPSGPYKAIFPASTYVSGHFELPATQTYSAGKFNAPMYAESGTNTLSFKNIFGVLKISVPCTMTVKSISVSSDLVMNGTFTIDDNVAKMVKSSEITDADKVVTLDCGAGVSGTDFFIAVPAGTYTGKNLKIIVIDSDNKEQAMTTSQKSTVSIAVNTIYSISFKDNTPIDLSALGTANCYIVSEAGTYKFKAVQGNSSTSVGEIKGVKVLWETFGTDVKPSVGDLIKANVSYVDNYITFSTNEIYKEGNAVIAAFSDTSCSDGNVLWSWHIWLTDSPNEQVYEDYWGRYCGIMLDRNLGATNCSYDIPSLGLLYQWGRKDPFLNGTSYNENAQAKWSSVIIEEFPEVVPATDQTITAEYSNKHPVHFISYNRDYSTELSWSKTKNINDPCPYGWKVPQKNSNNTTIWRDSMKEPNNDGESFWGNSNIPWSSNNSIIFRTESNPRAYYPAAGFLKSSGDLSGVGLKGNYWYDAEAPVKSGPSMDKLVDVYFYAYCMNFARKDVPKDSYLHTTTNDEKYNAFSIRCEKDN